MSERLCVKELAGVLRVSKNYVYEMRACGFKMQGLKRQNRTATVAEAMFWIRDVDFRLNDGRGVVGSGPCERPAAKQLAQQITQMEQGAAPGHLPAHAPAAPPPFSAQ